MPWSFIIPAAASLLGGKMQADAASNAASAANAQADKSLALQQRMYEEGIARQQPYANIGLEFTNRLADLNRGGAAATNMLTMDPGYNFRLSEGLKAVDRQAAARGGLISGGALKASQRYGQSMASQEYQNAYNRMAGLAGLGPSAAGVQNTLGQNYATGAGNIYDTMGTNTGNALLSSANARASSYTGAGNQLGKYLGSNPNFGGSAQAAFSGTDLGSSGFGSGLAYGNQDLGQYL